MHKTTTKTTQTHATPPRMLCVHYMNFILLCVCVCARAGWWHKKNSIDRGILYKRKLIRSSCFPYSILGTPSKLLFSFGVPFLPLPRFIACFSEFSTLQSSAVCGVHFRLRIQCNIFSRVNFSLLAQCQLSAVIHRNAHTHTSTFSPPRLLSLARTPQLVQPMRFGATRSLFIHGHQNHNQSLIKMMNKLESSH